MSQNELTLNETLGDSYKIQKEKMNERQDFTFVEDYRQNMEVDIEEKDKHFEFLSNGFWINPRSLIW